jgi:hypothetical protein
MSDHKVRSYPKKSGPNGVPNLKSLSIDQETNIDELSKFLWGWFGDNLQELAEWCEVPQESQPMFFESAGPSLASGGNLEQRVKAAIGIVQRSLGTM